MAGVLLAAIVLVTVSQPTHAYLYTGWSASPSISGNGNDAGGGAMVFPLSGKGHRLEWKIEKSDLAHHDTITLPDATFDLARCPFPGADKDSTGSFTTPIPSTVWLIGSAILCLIGLQRRRGWKDGCLY